MRGRLRPARRAVVGTRAVKRPRRERVALLQRGPPRPDLALLGAGGGDETFLLELLVELTLLLFQIDTRMTLILQLVLDILQFG